MIAELMQPDFTAAQTKIESSLGFDTNVDLLNYDPLAAITLGDNNGLPVFAQQAKLQNLVFQTTQVISDGSNLDSDTVGQIAINLLIDRINNNNAIANNNNLTPNDAAIAIGSQILPAEITLDLPQFSLNSWYCFPRF